jgi:hypothetical protein
MRLRSCVLVLVLCAGTSLASARSAESWLVQAGKSFQRAGGYTTRGESAYVQAVIDKFGRPSNCRVVGSPNHAVFTWLRRGLLVDAWTYGRMPENGCVSPDLIHVSEIRLTDPRWRTSFGLRIGDRTARLRRLYPDARDYGREEKFHRGEYWLVVRHGPCIGACSAYERSHGVDSPRLTAQIRNGHVVAFWLPVFAQGE